MTKAAIHISYGLTGKQARRKMVREILANFVRGIIWQPKGGKRRETSVARLIVEALSEDTIAEPGNRRPNYIVVSVTDEEGRPVSGLDASNFRVDAMIVGPGGALVDITDVKTGRLPGFYHINVVPMQMYTWKSGTYIFAVAVEAGAGRGQTLTSVVMD